VAFKKFVIMNHTNMQGHHFGCARVMSVIEQNIMNRGGQIIGRLDGKQNWQVTSESLALIAKADAVIVNGEGTLHGGRKKASWLVDVADHPISKDKELSLINTIYQNNPDSWGTRLARFDHIYARDSLSAKNLSVAVGRDVPWIGDLSTSMGALPAESAQRKGIIVGDSVKNRVTRALAVLSINSNPRADLVPLTISLREENPFKPWISRKFRHYSLRLRQAKLQAKFPNLKYLESEQDYLNLLQKKELSITGRFHGVCLNLIAGTPFVCISSNSWKIEALFADVGLDKRRLITVDQLSSDFIAQSDWNYSDSEIEGIERFLSWTNYRAEEVFDEIVGAKLTPKTID
jgi:hypothetical protein